MGYTEQIIIEMIMKEKASKGLKKVAKNAATVTKEVRRIGDYTVVLEKSFNSAGKQIGMSLRNITKQTNRFRGELLSLMFFGMALERTFLGFTRGAWQAFSKTVEGTTKANNAVTELSAAWNFFKFSFMDALSQSGLLNVMVAALITLVDWWSNLSDGTKKFIASAVLVVGILGAIIAGIAMIGLGIDAIMQVAFFSWLAKGFASVLGWMTRLIVSIVTGGAVTMGVWAIFLFLLGFIIAGIKKIKDKYASWWDFFKGIGAGAYRLMVYVWAGIKMVAAKAISYMIEKLLSFLKWLKKVAAVYDKFAGTNYASQIQKAISAYTKLRNAMDVYAQKVIYNDVKEADKKIQDWLNIKYAPGVREDTKQGETNVTVNQTNIIYGSESDAYTPVDLDRYGFSSYLE